jgi:hypothetical protein
MLDLNIKKISRNSEIAGKVSAEVFCNNNGSYETLISKNKFNPFIRQEWFSLLPVPPPCDILWRGLTGILLFFKKPGRIPFTL